jgi:fumarate reductase subunit D
MSLRLYIWQRLTAALMAPLVLVHVAVIFYASRKGLTAADILGRTRGSIMWASFYGAFVAAAAIHASIGLRHRVDRMVTAARASGGYVLDRIRASPPPARFACGRSSGAAMRASRLQHRTGILWIAALVHRLAGLALAIFLPLHFLTLGLAIDGEARLDIFLRWTDAPLVKLSEAALVFLLLVHMLGGLRLLVVENLEWHDGQKQLATLAAAVSAVLAFIFLVRAL